jgi:hypothetical protein
MRIEDQTEPKNLNGSLKKQELAKGLFLLRGRKKEEK